MQRPEDEVLKNWRQRVISPVEIMKMIKPGMRIFLGSGVSEPRTLVKHLMRAETPNIVDLELIQLFSFGDAITLKSLRSQKYRLKTFFADWVAQEAIAEGWVDLIPSRVAWIPHLISSGQMPVDTAFVQVTPPNAAGYCCLGISVDVARQAMEQARLTVGEINPNIPRTFGDTFVPVSDFDYFVSSEDQPIYFDRPPVNHVLNQMAGHIAAIIEDGSCMAFFNDPVFEALPTYLKHKQHLGIHSPVLTDPLMDLVKAGVVTNQRKEFYRGISLVSYAMGSRELLNWLEHNPLVEFQRINMVLDPLNMGRNPRFTVIFPAWKVDLFGRIALPTRRGTVALGPAEVAQFIQGTEISSGGQAIFALPSRDRKANSNVCLAMDNLSNRFVQYESVTTVVTEFGTANLKGRTMRERAQALIEIAHPGDRAQLVEKAKKRKILYPDQIFLPQSAHLYPSNIQQKTTFKGGVAVRSRPIKPSDEEQMRRLFYRFSDQAVYYRYFHTIRAMPHAKMQAYVNVDWSQTMSIVGLAGEPGAEQIIAESRYIKNPHDAFAEIVFVVDEPYQGLGIATHLYRMLVRLAMEQGLKGLTADVLFSNIGAMKVFRNGGLPVKARLENGIYSLTIPFTTNQTPH
jgi:acyl-CoA hydrolase/GNAT superfamily N-acetyltransferase